MKRITKFSQIIEQLPYSAGYRGLLQSYHSTVVSAVLSRKTITRSFGKHAVRIINLLSYRCINHEDLQWNPNDPLNIVDSDISEDSLQSALSDMYLTFQYIKWSLDDIEVVAESDTTGSEEKQEDTKSDKDEVSSGFFKNTQPTMKIVSNTGTTVTAILPTQKEDLSIQPPVIPTFNVSSVRCATMIGDCTYAIYDSLPTIPKKQNQISVTTDVTKMSRSDLLALYPNCRIYTRAKVLCDRKYTPEGLKFHPVFGTILPIEGYTEEQLIDNIIRYPHFYKLSKLVNDEVIGFYSTVEIDGELHKIRDIWNDLPESDSIPYVVEFVREYVVRRYLLERDIKGIEHKYPMFGTLEPFLTLFTTPDEYIELGYKDIEGMARQCVQARVSYKRSRNPIIRLVNSMSESSTVNTYMSL